jgi:hypothetical protein
MSAPNDSQDRSAGFISPQRARIQKVGRIGHLLCTLSLALIGIVGGIVVISFVFAPATPLSGRFNLIFDSSGVRTPWGATAFILSGFTWLSAIWILRRLFLEFSHGSIFSLRNARSICLLGVITLCGMLRFDCDLSNIRNERDSPKETAALEEKTPSKGLSITLEKSVSPQTPVELPISENPAPKKITIGFDLEYLLAGMLLLAIGWGLEQGVILQEEQDLTV